MYEDRGLSMKQISTELNLSVSTVNYWMNKHNISKRSRKEAGYLLYNPDGDPFTIRKVNTKELAELYGLGMGLYWGEGTKADKNSVRLGNSDAHLMNKFIEFLEIIYQIDRKRLKFSIQVFTDIDVQEAEEYWQKVLRIPKEQFTKTTVSKSVSKGSYRKRSRYGVVTLYFANTKLRNLLVDALPAGGVKYQTEDADVAQ